jgi:hypothetical protein
MKLHKITEATGANANTAMRSKGIQYSIQGNRFGIRKGAGFITPT